MKYNSKTLPGSDYSRPLAELLPDIIGKRSKSTSEIAKASGRTGTTVKNVVARLHKQGQVHIKRWKRTAGPWVACFFWGPGTDAKRPDPEPRSVITKRYRQTEKGKKTCLACRKRWKRSAAGKEYFRKYHGSRWTREKFATGGVAAIDPLLAAIMGPK